MAQEHVFNMQEVALCKSCGTAKHVNSNGLCGRCVAAPDGQEKP